MKNEIFLKCNNLEKSFGKLKVLKGCSLEIKQGELVGLVGENGSGKTTFIRCLLGFTRPNSGELKIQGPVGYCPQDNYLNRRLCVNEHLKLTESIYKKHIIINKDFVEKCIQQFKLQQYLKTRIGALSSGTYQKVKFLTSIYHRPKLILLDEPYDGFDWRMYIVFWEIMEELKSQGSSMVIISHLIYDYEKFDRIFELREGKIDQAK